MVRVYALKLDDNINESCYQYLLPKASEQIKNKVIEFRNKKDAYRSLFADFLAKFLIIQSINIPNDELTFHYSPFGKPYLAQQEKIHFNLSHSGEWIVCAISDGPVGIDIEHQVPIDLSDMASYFSAGEQFDLHNLPHQLQQTYFYELWTLKESFLKYCGTGLSKPLNNFSMKIIGEHITLETYEETITPLSFKLYNIKPDYKMAVCAETEKISKIIHLPLSQITANF